MCNQETSTKLYGATIGKSSIIQSPASASIDEVAKRLLHTDPEFLQGRRSYSLISQDVGVHTYEVLHDHGGRALLILSSVSPGVWSLLCTESLVEISEKD